MNTQCGRPISSQPPIRPIGDRQSARLANHQGNVALGPRLVVGVGRPSGQRRRPAACFFIRRRRAGCEVVYLGSILDGDLWVGQQVEVPDGMLSGTPLRGHDQVILAIVDADERSPSHLAGLPADGGEDDALGAVELEAVLAIRG